MSTQSSDDSDRQRGRPADEYPHPMEVAFLATWPYIVWSIAVAAIGGLITLGFRESDIGRSIGTGLVAGGVTLFLLTAYEVAKNAVGAEQQRLLKSQGQILLRQEEEIAKQAQKIAEQDRTLRSRAPVDPIEQDPEDLYCKARKVVKETRDVPIYVTDFRFIRRTQEENEQQEKYLASICEYYRTTREAQPYCRVVAAAPDQWGPLRNNLVTLQPIWDKSVDPKVRVKAYVHNPVQVDLLIGQNAVLLAFSDHTFDRLRTGLLIESDRVARAMRRWFQDTVWDPESAAAEKPTLIPNLDALDKHINRSQDGTS